MSDPTRLIPRPRRARPEPVCVVLTCQGCPYAWEPGTVERTEFDALMRQGCPVCGDWLWLGELVEVGAPG